MDHEPDYTTLLTLLANLLAGVDGKPIPPGQHWKMEATSLAAKLMRHLVSMKALADKSTWELPGLEQFHMRDHGSVSVLARAALEAYLVFSYIYKCNDESEGLFRYRAWRLGGLLDRKRLAIQSDAAEQVQAGNLAQIEELRELIADDPHFSLLSEKQKKQLLNWDWKGGRSFADLAVEAEIHEGYFKNIYNYLVGYAHSNFMVLQTIEWVGNCAF